MPPKSVVRFCPKKPKRAWKKDVGKVYRIGFYGRVDGLDCIWLVDDEGEYAETVDHGFLFKHFDILVVSDETDLYGISVQKSPLSARPELTVLRNPGKIGTDGTFSNIENPRGWFA
jgi:hypothetical protein